MKSEIVYKTIDLNRWNETSPSNLNFTYYDPPKEIYVMMDYICRHTHAS